MQMIFTKNDVFTAINSLKAYIYTQGLTINISFYYRSTKP